MRLNYEALIRDGEQAADEYHVIVKTGAKPWLLSKVCHSRSGATLYMRSLMKRAYQTPLEAERQYRILEVSTRIEAFQSDSSRIPAWNPEVA